MVRVRLTRTQAIKASCFYCMGFQRLARICTDTTCPNYPYRLGREDLAAWPPIIEKLKSEGYFKKSDSARKAARKRVATRPTASNKNSKPLN